MTTRKYSSRSQQTTLSAALTSSATTATVVSGSSLLGGVTVSAGETFTVVIDPDTALEEIVDITAVSTNTLTIVRGIDGSSGQAHSAGAIVRHMAIGRDYREANTHIEATTGHGATGAVVGTTNTQTLTNKTLTSPTITGTGAIAGTFTGNLTGNVTGNLTGNASTVTNGVYTTDTGTVTSTMIANGTIVNADINASAAIDKTKISGTAVTVADIGTVTSTMIANDTIVNADINSSAQIGYGKLSLTNSIVNADINASAAIDKTKISGTAITAGDTGTVTSTMIADGTIVNADINASAAIDWTKIAPSSTVSATELGYLDGVTSAIQTQIDSKLGTSTAASTYAPLASPALTGVPTAPTAAANTNTTQIATTAYVQTEIADLIASAPGALDTLNELAASLGNDANFSTTVTNSLATKLPLAGGTMSGAIAMGSNKITGLGTPTATGDAATKDYADTKLALSGGTMSGAIAMGANKITGLGDPTNAQDAVTKYYLDNVVLAPSNLTGPITSVGAATSIASQTGTGTKFVMDTSPTLVTPNIGVATATSINGTTIPTSKTLVATDSTTYVVPSQTGNSGKYLTTDGTTSSWGTVATTSAATPTTLGTVHGETSTTLTDPVSLGYNALLSNTSGVSNTAVGAGALTANTTGPNNTAVGKDALAAHNGSVGQNTAVGTRALDAATTGSSNTAIGVDSLGAVITGSNNTAVGANALLLNTASNNTAVGTSALDSNTTGTANTAIGKDALQATTTVANQTAVGYSALYVSTGAGNTAVGSLAGQSITGGTSNTVIGYDSGTALTTGSNNTAIGNGAAPTSASVSNEVTIGNTSITRFRVPGIGLDITSAGPAAATVTTAATGIGYTGIPQNATTTGAYTIVATDAGKHIYSTATRTVTIDSNANLALPVGTVVSFISGAGATTTIAITTDTMYLAGTGTTGSRTLAAHGMATAVKVAATTWYISGNGLS